MKKILPLSVLAIAIAAIIATSSCKKDPMNVPYSLSDIAFCIPAGMTSLDTVLELQLNHTDIVAKITNAGVTDLSRVLGAQLKNIKLVVNGATNLDSVVGAQLYLKTNITDTARTQIASTNTITSGLTEITLNLTGTEMKQVVSSDMVLEAVIYIKPSATNTLCYKFTSGEIDISVRK